MNLSCSFLLFVSAFRLACADHAHAPGIFSWNVNVTNLPDINSSSLGWMDDGFYYTDPFDGNIRFLHDWSVYNYSTEEWKASSSVVRSGAKTYDPLSFANGHNDTYGKLILHEGDCWREED